MKLAVREATHQSFEIAKTIYGPDKGDLCAAAIPFGWAAPEASDLESARKRAEWSCQQQQDFLDRDPTVRLMQVVDEDNNEDIVAFARWHRYPEGFKEIGDMETCGAKDRNDPATWLAGFDKELYTGVLDDLVRQRIEWIGNQHCWILTNIKTREPLQKRGAATLLLRWGLEQAAKEGVPAYLEAALSAVHLYESVGFREIGRMKVDCSNMGHPGLNLQVAVMRANPKPA